MSRDEPASIEWSLEYISDALWDIKEILQDLRDIQSKKEVRWFKEK